MKAQSFLNKALTNMESRAALYDSPGGERSMCKTVEMFNALCDTDITDEQGWLFMTILKIVRAQQGEFSSDSYEDGAAYFSLAGEAAYDMSIARTRWNRY